MSEAHENDDGTFNGVSIFAELTGLSEAEVLWTFDRIKALYRDGKSKEEAKAIVKAEAVVRPWEKREGFAFEGEER